ncbi:hypothetical protein RC74_15060 [Falsihalocynthiibacter arcticus]|uniref:Uncharacterized protein n=1 Tax=Falsihalocynthiibacter arcticus TaxID=1579316 RepID=A0A126V281_9RHOB|nr:hypothetical protein RC74_15060 [Falsihalocynthiibacter arcticus]
MPNLGGIDPVPMACFALFQQKINAGPRCATFVIGLPRLAVIAAFGWGARLSWAMILSAVCMEEPQGLWGETFIKYEA